MITCLHLCFQHAHRVRAPETLHFAPGLNILVGPNGTGKSTVLYALHRCPHCRVEMDGTPSVEYFDAETMNPHVAAGAPGSLRAMALKTRGQFSSHGQIMKAALASVPVRQGGTLLADEPESGQDLAGVETVRQGFAAICVQGGQVIAATHSPLFLEGAHLIELTPGYAEQIQAAYCRPG